MKNEEEKRRVGGDVEEQGDRYPLLKNSKNS